MHIQYTVDTLPQFNLVQRLRCPVACRPISADVMLSDRACLNSNPLAGGAWALRGLTSDFIRLSCYWSNLVPREDPGNEVVIDHEFYFLIRLDPLGDNIFYDKCRTFSLLSNYPPLKAYRHINFNLCDASTTLHTAGAREIWFHQICVPPQIKRGILKLTTSRGKRNLCTVFIFVSFEEKSCTHVIVSFSLFVRTPKFWLSIVLRAQPPYARKRGRKNFLS